MQIPQLSKFTVDLKVRTQDVGVLAECGTFKISKASNELTIGLETYVSVTFVFRSVAIELTAPAQTVTITNGVALTGTKAVLVYVDGIIRGVIPGYGKIPEGNMEYLTSLEFFQLSRTNRTNSLPEVVDTIPFVVDSYDRKDNVLMFLGRRQREDEITGTIPTAGSNSFVTDDLKYELRSNRSCFYGSPVKLSQQCTFEFEYNIAAGYSDYVMFSPLLLNRTASETLRIHLYTDASLTTLNVNGFKPNVDSHLAVCIDNNEIRAYINSELVGRAFFAGTVVLNYSVYDHLIIGSQGSNNSCTGKFWNIKLTNEVLYVGDFAFPDDYTQPLTKLTGDKADKVLTQITGKGSKYIASEYIEAKDYRGTKYRELSVRCVGDVRYVEFDVIDVPNITTTFTVLGMWENGTASAGTLSSMDFWRVRCTTNRFYLDVNENGVLKTLVSPLLLNGSQDNYRLHKITIHFTDGEVKFVVDGVEVVASFTGSKTHSGLVSIGSLTDSGSSNALTLNISNIRVLAEDWHSGYDAYSDSDIGVIDRSLPLSLGTLGEFDIYNLVTDEDLLGVTVNTALSLPVNLGATTPAHEVNKFLNTGSSYIARIPVYRYTKPSDLKQQGLVNSPALRIIEGRDGWYSVRQATQDELQTLMLQHTSDVARFQPALMPSLNIVYDEAGNHVNMKTGVVGKSSDSVVTGFVPVLKPTTAPVWEEFPDSFEYLTVQKAEALFETSEGAFASGKAALTYYTSGSITFEAFSLNFQVKAGNTSIVTVTNGTMVGITSATFQDSNALKLCKIELKGTTASLWIDGVKVATVTTVPSVGVINIMPVSTQLGDFLYRNLRTTREELTEDWGWDCIRRMSAEHIVGDSWTNVDGVSRVCRNIKVVNTGPFGSAIRMDSNPSNAYLSMGLIPWDVISKPFALDYWIKEDVEEGRSGLFPMYSWPDETKPEEMFFIGGHGENQEQFAVWNNNGTAVYVPGNFRVGKHMWRHVAIQYTGTHIQVYANGRLLGQLSKVLEDPNTLSMNITRVNNGTPVEIARYRLREGIRFSGTFSTEPEALYAPTPSYEAIPENTVVEWLGTREFPLSKWSVTTGKNSELAGNDYILRIVANEAVPVTVMAGPELYINQAWELTFDYSSNDTVQKHDTLLSIPGSPVFLIYRDYWNSRKMRFNIGGSDTVSSVASANGRWNSIRIVKTTTELKIYEGEVLSATRSDGNSYDIRNLVFGTANHDGMNGNIRNVKLVLI